MSSLLYFILSVVAFYYIFKFAMRLLLPYFMKKLTERMMKKAQQGGGFTYTSGNPFGQANPFESNRSQHTRSRQDNKVRVDYVPQEEKRRGTETAGEFIDFEEVK